MSRGGRSAPETPEHRIGGCRCVSNTRQQHRPSIIFSRGSSREKESHSSILPTVVLLGRVHSDPQNPLTPRAVTLIPAEGNWTLQSTASISSEDSHGEIERALCLDFIFIFK